MAIPRWEAFLYVSLVSLIILSITTVAFLALQYNFNSTCHTPIHLVLTLLSLFTYLQTHFTHTGNATDWPNERPDLLYPHASPHARELPPQHQSASNTSDEEAPSKPEGRWCTHCATPKPLRVHHCSQCSACVLRFDHHCPWVGNCIGMRNIKSFILFLLYTTLCAAHTCFILVKAFVKTRAHRGVLRGCRLAVAMVTPVALAASMVSFMGVGALLCWNLWLVGRNETALENLIRQDGKGGMDYSAGVMSNFRHALGWNPMLWLLPIRQRRGPHEKRKE